MSNNSKLGKLFKNRLFRGNVIMNLVFYIVTLMLLACLVIYGFDIDFNGGRKALTSQFKNRPKSEYYYEINDEFVFSTDIRMDDYVGVHTYEMNTIPFCFTCGWNSHKSGDYRDVRSPAYISGDLVYSSEPDEDGFSGKKNAYTTLNLKTGEFGYVMDPEELGDDPFNESKRLTFQWVSKHYQEISFQGGDDIDCAESFMMVYAVYVLLFAWWLLLILIRLLRRLKTNT